MKDGERERGEGGIPTHITTVSLQRDDKEKGHCRLANSMVLTRICPPITSDLPHVHMYILNNRVSRKRGEREG